MMGSNYLRGGQGFREFISLIEKLALTTPNISQALSRTVQLGNTGHRVTFGGLSGAQEIRAREELKRFAKDAFAFSAGIDGFVNKILRQICITGALSAEWVPADSLDGVEKVVIVPTRQVRFKLKDEEYIPFQQLGLEEIELNRNQYMYIPLMSLEESPYAVPPYLSALSSVLIEKDSLANIAKIIKKFGLLGFLTARKKKPLFSFGKAENEYKKELEEGLREFAENFKKDFSEGVAASYDDIDYDYKSFGADTARGAKDIFQEVEQQMASGLDIDPALLGRTYSTTETYAGVVYAAFLASLNNSRRMIKRFLERGYFMHLVMRGYLINSVSVDFNPDRGMRPREDAEAEEIRVRTVLAKLMAGIIDEDQAAQELGYEKASGNKPGSSENSLKFSDFLAKKKALR